MAINLMEFRNPGNKIPLRAARGHFATSHSHINYYIDLTMTKHCLSEAREVAVQLASRYKASTVIDTILCLDGTEVIGACMASELTKSLSISMNSNRTIYVLTPEHTTGSQLIFRDNTKPMITGKQVLILGASVTTGYTVMAAVEAINYYGGTPVGICAIFSFVNECEGFPVNSIFDEKDLMEDYQSMTSHDCILCKRGVKLDAMVNTYGISSFDRG
ncbi:MAG: orotate phosphoribosyltransferase [Parasporobacterium sp.]|nr:orotate phosphoribosyltransferase [Parasporobacterium sp.]